MKKRLAKTLSLLLTLCTVFALCAATASAADAPAGDGYVIGYDIYFVGNTWSVQLWKEFESAVKRHSDKVSEVIYVESEGDTAKQVANIEDLITQGVDAIITTPNSPTALVPVLRQAREADIKVVLLAATIESQDYDALVSVNDYDFGKVGAEWLVEQLGGEGKIVLLNGIAGLSASEDRTQGAMDVFNTYPGIEVIADAYASWDYAEAKIAMGDLLAANPEIDGVWSQGGAMTMGAIEAFQAAGRPLVPMTGEDNNGFLKMWKNLQSEGFSSVAASKPTWMSELALEAAIALLDGAEVVRDNVMEVPVFSDDELDNYVKPELSDSFFSNTRLSEEELAEIFQD